MTYPELVNIPRKGGVITVDGGDTSVRNEDLSGLDYDEITLVCYVG